MSVEELKQELENLGQETKGASKVQLQKALLNTLSPSKSQKEEWRIKCKALELQAAKDKADSDREVEMLRLKLQAQAEAEERKLKAETEAEERKLKAEADARNWATDRNSNWNDRGKGNRSPKFNSGGTKTSSFPKSFGKPPSCKFCGKSGHV